ncbi:MAG: hypothetical protein ACREVG_02500, partial [Burkholderiales bacterium]
MQWLLGVLLLGAAAAGYYYTYYLSARAEDPASKPAPAAKKGKGGLDPSRAVPVIAATARSTDLNIFLNGLGPVTPLKTVIVR